MSSGNATAAMAILAAARERRDSGRRTDLADLDEWLDEQKGDA